MHWTTSIQACFPYSFVEVCPKNSNKLPAYSPLQSLFHEKSDLSYEHILSISLNVHWRVCLGGYKKGQILYKNLDKSSDQTKPKLKLKVSLSKIEKNYSFIIWHKMLYKSTRFKDKVIRMTFLWHLTKIVSFVSCLVGTDSVCPLRWVLGNEEIKLKNIQGKVRIKS